MAKERTKDISPDPSDLPSALPTAYRAPHVMFFSLRLLYYFSTPSNLIQASF